MHSTETLDAIVAGKLSVDIFRHLTSNPRGVMLVTDGGRAGRNNEIDMISRRAIRRGLSLGLSLAIVLWANNTLAMLPGFGHHDACHVRMTPVHHPTAHAMPCCPPHLEPAPTQWGDRPGCCDMSSQPARPVAFLIVPGNSSSFQLSANVAAGTALLPAASSSSFSSTDGSPPFTRHVFQLKTDLRI